MVHEPPGRCHDDLRVLRELLDLLLDLRPAVDHRDTDILVERGKPLELVADLDGKLSRRRENQPLQILAAGVDVLEHRNAECEGLARTGGRFGDDVLPLHERRNCLRLNARRVTVALLFERLQNFLR